DRRSRRPAESWVGAARRQTTGGSPGWAAASATREGPPHGVPSLASTPVNLAALLAGRAAARRALRGRSPDALPPSRRLPAAALRGAPFCGAALRGSALGGSALGGATLRRLPSRRCALRRRLPSACARPRTAPRRLATAAAGR